MDIGEALLQQLLAQNYIERVRLGKEQADVWSVLSKRDGAIFSEKWMRVFHVLEQQKAQRPLPSHIADLVHKLREVTFLQTFSTWENSELAALASDDFGLIGEAIALNVSDPFVNGIYLSYVSGILPSEDLLEAPGNIYDIVGGIA